MAFDSLISQPRTELEIAQAVIQEIQHKFIAYKNLFFFVKLELCDEKKSKIAWFKCFHDQNSFDDFYFDTKMQRALIFISYSALGYYDMDCFGFHLLQQYKVFPNDVEQVVCYEPGFNIETDSMPTREQLAAMTGQLKSAISSGRRK